MAFSTELLDDGEEIWAAQFDHPFVTELADGTLEEAAFRHWIEQDYRYLLEFARTYAVAGVKARDEAAMATFLGGAHAVLDEEMDLHREFADDYGIDRAGLERVEKAPTCRAYTDFLVRTAYDRPEPVIAAALFPCMQGYHDVGHHMADLADGEHRYTPFIETYTSEAFAAETESLRELVDRYGDEYPGYRDEMREAFLTSARLELAFWEMAYTQEVWEL